MTQLKSTAIRKQIHDLCEFCISTVKEKTLRYDKGLNRETVLDHLQDILKEVDSGRDFTIAFVGEYSSGKTTLINLLTNTRRPTGTNVTTDDPSKFRWNDIWIIDTPGLGSGRQEHDRKTEEWLASADLLVYVLTPDLFVSRSGKRFLEMLDKYKREHEMMLVVNMIDKEGNDIAVYREELQEALGHRPLENYYPTFISAKDKEISLDPQSPSERRPRLAERSRFDTFVTNLNTFVLDRKERACLTTPLARLQALMRKIRFIADYDKEDSLLDLRMSALERALRETKHAYSDFRDEMNDAATSTAGAIFDAIENPPADFNSFSKDQMEMFVQKCNDSVSHLADMLNTSLEVLQDENLSIDKSQLAKDVRGRIKGSDELKEIFESFTPMPTAVDAKGTMSELIAGAQQLAEISGQSMPKQWADTLNSGNVIKATSKMVGMIDRNVVLKVGRRLGHKFKPWEAVKLSAKLSKAVPLLNIAATAWEVESHRREKKQEEAAIGKLRQFKTDVKAMLKESSDEIVKAVYNELIGNVEKIISGSLELVREKKLKLSACSKDHKESCKELEVKRAQCLHLYDEIYGTCPE